MPFSDACFSIFVMGASGDLAKKKTYPALFELFVAGLLPPKTLMVGYARSHIEDSKFRETLRPTLAKKGSPEQVTSFLSSCIFRAGGYDDEKAMKAVSDEVAGFESAFGCKQTNRLFYFAVPPSVFTAAAKTLNASARSTTGWNRIVVEKPFGHDLASSHQLQRELGGYFSEEETYRVDHYLGKELVQSLFTLRFANAVWEPLWNRNHISSVTIAFKEDIGTEGRGGYFDSSGIIRDVLQNHLMQVLSLVAMEPPVSASAEDVRDEKLKVLRCTAPIDPSEVVVGQFGPSASGDKKGYIQETGVPADSITPTFATAILHVNNARWKGVPFIMKAGKALNERKAEIRIQFKAPTSGLFSVGPSASAHQPRTTITSASSSSSSSVSSAAAAGAGAAGITSGPLRDRAASEVTDPDACRVGVGQHPICGTSAGSVHNNELVIRIQPNEAIYLKMMAKEPGLSFNPVETELDLSYKRRYTVQPPEAYARLLLDVLRGDQSQFVRADELQAAWAIVTPLLHHLEKERVRPIVYPFGSRGPAQSDLLVRRQGGYVYAPDYSSEWRRSQDPEAARGVLYSIARDFGLPTERLRSILASFMSEMKEGMRKPEGSTIKMIPSYVTDLPTGKEVGVARAVDMGGTNLRVVEVIMHGGGRLEHKESAKGSKRIPPEMQSAPGPVLFDFIATTMKDAGVPDGAIVGFTFSYPTLQRAINAGELIEWTKGFTSEGVEGSNVVRMLEEACIRQGMKNIHITALVNDTVGTLMTTAYSEPSTCRIGVIIGTGSNAAYVEKADRIPKWASVPGNKTDGLHVINMEWGGFGSGTDKTMLPFTAADEELDAHSTHPGKQRYEKMISGLYLGEITRLLLLQLIGAGALFVPQPTSPSSALAEMTSPMASASSAGADGTLGSMARDRNAAGKALEVPESFETWMVSEICVDETPDLINTAFILKEKFGIDRSALEDRKVVKQVSTLVARRAARLAAVGVAGCVLQMKEAGEGVVIDSAAGVSAGIDGSVFKKHPLVRVWMAEALRELGVSCELHEAVDGSGRGAAIIAVTAAKAMGLMA